jgi:hypothetical protein
MSCALAFPEMEPAAIKHPTTANIPSFFIFFPHEAFGETHISRRHAAIDPIAFIDVSIDTPPAL